jgi:hypothetical protein
MKIKTSYIGKHDGKDCMQILILYDRDAENIAIETSEHNYSDFELIVKCSKK